MELKREKLRRIAKNDLMFYARLCDPHYIASHVHYRIAEALKRVAEGKCKRLILNMPPRHGKSRLVAVELPTHYLGNNPKKHIVLTSYGSDLCYKHSREARARLMQPYYQTIFDTRLDPSDRSAMDWSTNAGGHYKAVGIGGSLTGHGADLLIVDDPFKDHEEAHSPTMREKVWDWFLSVAYTRLSPEGAIVIIHTRWHVDDLTGRLLDPQRREQMEDAGAKDEKWEVLNFPALALDNKDPLGRKVGQALFPEKFNEDRLKAIKATSGSYLWSSLYEGNPVPKGGNYIDSTNFQIEDDFPKDQPMKWFRFWDLAASEKESSDFTCGIAGALDKKGHLWLRDMRRGQWLWPKSRQEIVQTAMVEKDLHRRVLVVGVEAVGGFQTAYANLREVFPPDLVLMEIGADKDKLTRALPWIALTERKMVHLVKGDWILPFFAECEAFPSGAHDDMVDAVSGVYSMLTGAASMNFAPFSMPDKYTRVVTERRRRSIDG